MTDASRQAAALLAQGLAFLRGAYYAKRTRLAWGPDYPHSLLGQAEDAFMASPPVETTIARGLDLLRRSDAYRKTARLNVVPSAFAKTLMGKAEAKFVAALAIADAFPPSPFLYENGLQHIAPNGGDNFPAAKASGFGYAAFNVRDFTWSTWDRFVSGAVAAGLAPTPWGRMKSLGEARQMLSAARGRGFRRAILNVEKEIETGFPPVEVAGLATEFPEIWLAWQPDPWIPNSIDITPIVDAGSAILIEGYQNVDPRYTPQALAAHAIEKGAREVAMTFGQGAWGNAPKAVPPEVYLAEWAGPYVVYPADSVDPRKWARWPAKT